jgi:flavin-dependent dehydrogenase
MKTLLPVKIHGAGLAGMGLALLLSRRGVPVQVLDRSSGPQHRVCGEFLRGLNAEMIRTLDLQSILHDSPRHRTVGWWFKDELLTSFSLPDAVHAVGRPRLERHLQQKCEEAGVSFSYGSSALPDPTGSVMATGRKRNPRSPWFGFKIHVQNVSLSTDLEMHLSSCGYVGLSRIEEGWVNVSGLFRASETSSEGRSKNGTPSGRALHRMQKILHSTGFKSLSVRLEGAVEDPESLKSVAGITFGKQENREGSCVIGDAFAFIPPFTGSGMTMALQGAMISAESLEAYSRGLHSWESVCTKIRRNLQRQFSKKLVIAQGFHRLLSEPLFQPLLAKWARSGYLPVQTILKGIS